MLESLADLLVPPRCAICAAASPPRRMLCVRCARRLDALRPLRLDVGDVPLASAAPYSGVARELVSAMKFARRPGLARVAAARMQPLLAPSPRLLVPVPPAPARARWRGYDVAAALARELARCSGGHMLPCLTRDDGPRQVGRSRAMRLSDPPRVRLRRGALLPEAELCLVDDVVTTGATLLACAAALRAAGAGRLCALSFARSGAAAARAPAASAA